MRLLLDTHALLRALVEPDRLSDAAQSVAESLPLVSADRLFAGLPGLHVVW